MEGVVCEQDSLGVAYRGGVAYWNKLSGMMGAWLMGYWYAKGRGLME